MDNDRFVEAGTLKYEMNMSGKLLWVMMWLLVGGGAMTLLTCVMMISLQIMLKSAGATNAQITLIYIGGSFYNIMNVLMNPIVSSSSDRARTRWGRRRPFILWTMPFLLAGMVALPYMPEWMRSLPQDGVLAQVAALIGVNCVVLGIAAAAVVYYFGFFFVGSIYYYYYPDVVPNQYIGRFVSYLQIVNALTVMGYSFFLVQLIETHLKPILVGVATFYAIAVGCMCIFVKEGEYPPPQAKSPDHWWTKAYKAIRGYVVDCFSIKYYWLMFGIYIFWGVACVANGMMLFFQQSELGLSMKEIGYIGFYAQFLVWLNIPIGRLVDRFRGFTILFTGLLFFAGISILDFFLINGFYSALSLGLLRSIPLMCIQVALNKVLIDVYPREKYGQFCSAMAMLCSFVIAIFAWLAGSFFDLVKIYRMLFLWQALFAIPALILVALLYRAWKNRGEIKS